MTIKRSWLRRIGYTLPGVGLAAWIGWTGWRAQAQEPGIPATVTRSYLNKTTINLPIVIDERHRSQLRNILLYVKDGATQPWKLCDKATPAQTSFTYRAPGEGEYWFNIVSVDNTGRMTPADVSKEAPALIVVLDTQAPQIDVYPLDNAPEGQYIRCDWRDAHLDTFKSRLYYQTGDMVWRPLEKHPGKVNTFCVPAQANWTGNVRAVAVDLAGNTAMRDKNLSAGAAALPPSRPVDVPPPSAPPSVPNQITVIPTPQPPLITNAPPTPPSNVVFPAPPRHVAPAPLATNTRLPDRTDVMLPPMPRGNQHVAAIDPLPVVPPMPAPAIAHKTMPAEMTGTKTATPPSPQLFDPAVAARSLPVFGPQDLKQTSYSREPASIQRQFSNTSRLFLDYRIEAMGASGVGKVEVWTTRDLGQSWQKLCEDTDRQSPAEINLPGDGVYGVSLVISNGRGFGAAAPNPGDAPDSWVEVDTAKPQAELMQIRAGAGEDSGALLIAWSARDKNLPSDALELQYAGAREGPWHVVAKGLKNEGTYRWVPPVEVGAQAFIRLLVRDQANNVATAETPQPIPLDDASRPRGRVVSISTSPPQANPLPGMP